MKLLFDDDLVEAVVFLCSSGKRPDVPPLQLRRFHAERERCYSRLDPEDRATAFAQVQLSWFTEWGVGRRLAGIVGRFPPLNAALATLVFRKARGRDDEGAELYRNAAQTRQGTVALRPDRFADDAALARFLHHELAHLADMADEAFGYSPDLECAGQTASQQRLLRERYRLLWNVSVDGRLTGRGLATIADEARRQREFEAGFAFLPASRRAELFGGLWNGTIATHAALLAVAADPRNSRDVHAPVPGAHCPLCGFAAFHWADPSQLSSSARVRIHAEFTGWREHESICARCAEIFQSITGLEYPATVCL